MLICPVCLCLHCSARDSKDMSDFLLIAIFPEPKSYNGSLLWRELQHCAEDQLCFSKDVFKRRRRRVAPAEGHDCLKSLSPTSPDSEVCHASSQVCAWILDGARLKCPPGPSEGFGHDVVRPISSTCEQKGESDQLGLLLRDNLHRVITRQRTRCARVQGRISCAHYPY